MGPPSVADAARALEAGGLAVFPTETVWGLGARVDRPQAVARIFVVKGRDPGKPLQVLLASPDEVFDVAGDVAGAADLAEAFMPGPLTLVLPARRELPDLGAEGTVGVRVPDHPLALELLGRTGPLAATSANRSGEPTPGTLEEVRGAFGDDVDVYLPGPAPAGTASTVVDLSAGAPRVLRAGALPVAEIERVLGRPVDRA